jgi:RNA polymerase sigma-70 factor (ECF subfamily)
LNQYVAAFEKADVPTLTTLLREDAVMEMPPWLHWLAGRAAIARFQTSIFSLREPDAWRMLPTTANRQPAVAGLCAWLGRTPTRAFTASVSYHQHRHRTHRGLPESAPVRCLRLPSTLDS